MKRIALSVGATGYSLLTALILVFAFSFVLQGVTIQRLAHLCREALGDSFAIYAVAFLLSAAIVFTRRFGWFRPSEARQSLLRLIVAFALLSIGLFVFCSLFYGGHRFEVSDEGVRVYANGHWESLIGKDADKALGVCVRQQLSKIIMVLAVVLTTFMASVFQVNETRTTTDAFPAG